jgi:hypothetical protein
MPAKLEIEDLPQGLSFHVTEPRRMGRIIFGAAVGIAATLFFIHFSQAIPLKSAFGGLCAFSVIRSVFSGMRGTDVRLVISNLDFKSSGYAPKDYKSETISRADIGNLEYRKSSGGGEDQELPSGLYVERSGSVWQYGTCMLPDIDEAQTRQVIEAIYRRFPDTGTLAPVDSKSDLISLNLNRTDNRM